METLYVICWGSAGQDDDGNSKACSGVYDVYTARDKAKAGLENYKNEIYNEIVNNPDYEEERIEVQNSTQVSGSVEAGFFEIDYFIGDVPCEIHIALVEVKP